MSELELEATQLHSGRWAVRPKGQLGTIGWSPKPWMAQIVSAANAESAIRIAIRKGGCFSCAK